MGAIQAVIFDADGTLLDTREFILAAFEKVLKESGYAVPDRATIMKKAAGFPLPACYEALAPGADVKALCEAHATFQENNFALVDSYESLVLTLDTLRERGLKIAICTSRLHNTLPMLKHVGIADHCDVIVDGTHVTQHKPDPEGIELVLEKLNIVATETVMVGDTPADIGAGKNAGVAMTIAVTHGFATREVLEQAGADHVVDRLSDIIPLVIAEGMN